MKEKSFQQGLVSIITPVYQAERFIEQTILSVLAQSYQNWEMILVDDCSHDKSADIIRKYIKKDKRLKYHCLETNGGAAVARNKAIELAQGEFLAFLDSDDLWNSSKLEKQLAFMREHDCKFSFTRIRIIDSTNSTIKEIVSIPPKVDYNYLLKRTVIATSTVIIKRSALPYFTMPLKRGGQDYATWLQLLKMVDYAYGLDESLTSYRVSSNSLSSNKLSSIHQVYEIQTEDEHITKIKAICNTFFFCIYAFKKHFL